MPNAPEPFALLRSLNSPADLRAHPENRLGEICDELRDYLIKTVATRGGHFAAGLGTVELTVALHYVFDTPHDRLVWDVGHQAYPHKVLTGRRDRLDTIKQSGGLAPFPSRAESEYDTFGVGHSSTSISAALGMAVAAELAKEDRKVVAIIGDGAMTAGMAWEALFNAGARKTNLLVVLNDNDMSISENVGALSNYFAKVLSGRMYSTLRSGGKKILKQMPTMWELARRSEEMMKGMVLPGTLFEEFGFNFIGPIDGHDIKALVTNLRNMRNLDGPQLLHVVTRKGKGYDPAEKDPIKWHGPGPFDPVSGTIFKEKATGPTYSQVFGQWLCDMAARDRTHRRHHARHARRLGPRRILEEISAALFRRRHRRTTRRHIRGGARLRRLEARRRYLLHVPAARLRPADPRRGAAEPAGGVRAGPRRARRRRRRHAPGFVRLFVPALHSEPDRHGARRRERMPPDAVHRDHHPGSGGRALSARARSGRRAGRGDDGIAGRPAREIRREGTSGLLILAFGALVRSAEIIGERLDATVVNMRFVKPLDEELVLRLAAKHNALVTIEENAVAGGAGSAVIELLANCSTLAAYAHARHPRPLHRARLARRLPRGGRSSIRPVSRRPWSAGGTPLARQAGASGT